MIIMSMHYWSEDGYGVYCDDLKPSKEGLMKVLEHSGLLQEFIEFVGGALDIDPKNVDLNKIHVGTKGFYCPITYCQNLSEEYDIDDISFDGANPYDYTCGKLVFAILAKAISKEIEKITGEKDSVIYSVNFEDGYGAIMYLPCYAWQLKDVKLLTKEEYGNIFVSTLKMFGVKEEAKYLWDRVTIENCG